jgi:hypothetical protein
MVGWKFLGWLLAAVLLLSAGAAYCTDCAACYKAITGGCVKTDGRIYHPSCYHQHVAPRCADCMRVIEGEYVIYHDKNYHQHCYEDQVALRCSHCGEIIDGDYIFDHWGNKYHPWHKTEIGTCSFCGRLLSDPVAEGGHSFDFERSICTRCDREAIHDEAEGLRLLEQTRNLIAGAGVEVVHEEIEFKLISPEEMARLTGRGVSNHLGLTQFEESSWFGLLDDKEFTIYILVGLPRSHFILTAAHELMHVWQYLNASEEGEPPLVEGSCNYAALLALQQLNDSQAEYALMQLKEEPDLIYGDGFRRVKKLVDQRGLDFWLEHLKFDPDFPLGY